MKEIAFLKRLPKFGNPTLIAATAGDKARVSIWKEKKKWEEKVSEKTCIFSSQFAASVEQHSQFCGRSSAAKGNN